MCHVIFNAATATPATLPRDLDAVETIPGRRFSWKWLWTGRGGNPYARFERWTSFEHEFSFYGSSECFFFFEEVYWREERRGYVCFRDNKMRIFFDRNISFDPFNFLFSSSSSFVSRVSLFLSLSRIKENIEVIVSFYCKKIKFKLVSRLIIIYSA